MGYKIRDKRKRNEEIYQFRIENPELTYDEIGEKFELTGSRIFAIIKRLEEQKVNTN